MSSVTVWNLFHICFSNVPLLVWFGPLSPNVLGRITFRQIWNNVGVGVKHGFLLGKKYHPWGIGAIGWAIWKSCNTTCFDKKIIKSPLEILCHVSALMIFWAGLFSEMDRDQLIEGANLMLKVAKEVLARQTARHVNQLLLQDGQEDDTNEDSA